ncbi:MAG: penicillin acylase family protein, partial [Acidimicrobiia bacterium]|nr:penicillin acylase family protein [Acidimicrobiia bacterium]
AGGTPIVYDIRSTRHGPIISGIFDAADDLAEVNTGYPDGFEVSLAWQSLKPSTLVESILGINRASNWEEFREAASLWDIAAQNLIYADIVGNIGYQSTGEIPIRSGYDGRLPVPGWVSENDWTGIVPFEDMPFIFNPERGFIETANQPVLSAGTSPFIGIDGAYGYRADRIEGLIVDNAPHTVASFQEMQMDGRDGSAIAVVPALLATGSSSSAVIEIQDLLREWSLGLEGFQTRADSAGAAAYSATWRHLLLETFADDLPEDYHPAGGSRWFAIIDKLLENPEDPFWDDKRTVEIETAPDILERAMETAHTELTDLLGDAEDWRWGDLHTAVFENQTLGQSGIGPVDWLFNRSAPADIGGGPSIVNATGWTVTEGYFVDWVPSMRMVVDLGNLAASTSVHTTGQSGHAFHGNYADMIEMWVEGGQHPMLWSLADVEAAARNTLILVPGPG